MSIMKVIIYLLIGALPGGIFRTALQDQCLATGEVTYHIKVQHISRTLGNQIQDPWNYE